MLVNKSRRSKKDKDIAKGHESTQRKFIANDSIVESTIKGNSITEAKREQVARVKINAEKKKEEKRIKQAKKNAKKGVNCVIPFLTKYYFFNPKHI
jgi:hypothetical protein